VNDLRKRLIMKPERLQEINDFIMDENNPLVNDLLDIVAKYGGPEEINRRAAQASSATPAPLSR